MITRRKIVKGSLTAAATMTLASGASLSALAQGAEVKIALIAPLSGGWARSGELMQKGGELAVKHINEAGGIKSIGGAKMKLVVLDAGDSVEKAKNAAQRLVSSEPDVVGGTGAWLSSFTLAVTEVTERAEMPWLTLSYADSITARGFKHVFQTSPTASAQAQGTLPAMLALAEKATGKKPATVGMISDNTASPAAFSKAMREGALEKAGLKLLVDEVFTPPLADATPIVQKVRSAKPDLLIFIPTAQTDIKLLLEKLAEFGLAKGKIPLISNGAPMGTPEMLKVIGKDLMEGVIFSVANWPGKGQEAIIENFKKETGEPFMTQDSLCTYGDVMLLRAAIEKAGKADRKAVSAAMRELAADAEPAKYFPGGGVKFNEDGRRDKAEFVFAQWQGGEPITVFPEKSAMKPPIWPK